MGRISAIGWPWSTDEQGSRFAQAMLSHITIASIVLRTTEAPLCRIAYVPPIEETREIKVAPTANIEEVLTAITRMQARCARDNLTSQWTTSHLRPRRATGGYIRGSSQIAVHRLVIRVANDYLESTNNAVNAITVPQQELMAVHNAARQDHSTARIGAFVAGEDAYEEARGEWCVTWGPDEMGQVVHIPINVSTDDTYTAFKNMQSIADHCGAKVVPIESGIAIIGLAPAVAEVVIQRWPRAGNGIHQPRRFFTYRAHGTTEADIRFASPASGHDLMWMVATGGQIYFDRVAQALLDVLGEYPTTDMVCALHPETQTFEPMVQVSVPNHLRNLMIMGPAAEAFIQVGSYRCKVFPFRNSAKRKTQSCR